MRTPDQSSAKRCKDTLFLPFSATQFLFEISQFVLQKLESNAMRGSLDLAPKIGNNVIQRGQVICINFGFLRIHQFAYYIQSKVGLAAVTVHYTVTGPSSSRNFSALLCSHYGQS